MQQQQSLLFSLLLCYLSMFSYFSLFLCYFPLFFCYFSLFCYFLDGRMYSFFTTFLYSEFSFLYIQHT